MRSVGVCGAAGLLIAIAVPACAMEREARELQVVHPNGLSLRLPAEVSAQQIPDGFVVNGAAPRGSRVPEQVTVVLHEGSSGPEGDWPNTRVVGEREFSYRVRRDPGGSGGDVSVLVAWCRYPGGHVRLEQVAQAEWPAAPDDALAWTVMAGVGNPSRPAR